MLCPLLESLFLISTSGGLPLEFWNWLYHLLLQEAFFDASLSPFLSPSTMWLTLSCIRSHRVRDVIGSFVPSRLKAT